jgi:hypothetical protein
MKRDDLSHQGRIGADLVHAIADLSEHLATMTANTAAPAGAPGPHRRLSARARKLQAAALDLHGITMPRAQ